MTTLKLTLAVVALAGLSVLPYDLEAQNLVVPVKVVSHRAQAYTQYADNETMKRLQTLQDAILLDPDEAFFEAALANGLVSEGANLIAVTEDTTFAYELSYGLEDRNGLWTVAVANTWAMTCNGRLHRQSPGVWLYFQHEREHREAFVHRISRDVLEMLLSVEQTLLNILEHKAGEAQHSTPNTLADLAHVFCPDIGQH